MAERSQREYWQTVVTAVRLLCEDDSTEMYDSEQFVSSLRMMAEELESLADDADDWRLEHERQPARAFDGGNDLYDLEQAVGRQV